MHEVIIHKTVYYERYLPLQFRLFVSVAFDLFCPLLEKNSFIENLNIVLSH